MILKKRLLSPGVLFIIGLVMLLVNSAGIANATSFDPHRVADDQVFDNTASMSTYGKIDDFLNTLPNSCISTSNAFTAPDPTGYSPSSGFTYSGHVSAGQVIYDAAQVYGINPQVLLTTLQKEEGIVNGNGTYGCGPLSISASAGYGCTDSGTNSHSYNYTNGTDPGTLPTPLYFSHGNPVNSVTNTCVNSNLKAGFSEQVIHAAWLLKFGEQRSEGNVSWNVQANNFPQPGDHWDNSDDPQSCYGGPMTTGTFVVCPSGSATYYDGWSTIDGTAVHMENGATASLYWYTPHLSGNQSFFNIFTNWFGVPYANANDYTFVTSSATAINYDPGGTGSITIVLKNSGYNTWYSDHNLPTGQQSMRLATVGYQDSPFIRPDTNSLGTRNQVLMTPDVVAPGQNATFTFDVTAPYKTITSHTHFVPIIGGAFLKDVGMDVVLTANPPAWNPTSSSVDARDLLPNQQAHAHFAIQNNSTITWYSDGNVPVGQQPTRLATLGYQDSPFADITDSNWLGTRNQIKMNEASVAPGQTATFDAWFIAPIRSIATGNFFHFILIVGGVFAQDKGLAFNFTVPAANMTFTGISAANPPATMSTGQTATVSYTVKNTGNVVWQDELYQSGFHALRLIMNHPLYRSSPFYDSSDSNWLSVGQVRIPPGTVWPGQTVTFTFNWKAPTQTGSYHDPFQLAIGGLFYPDYGSSFNTTVQ